MGAEDIYLDTQEKVIPEAWGIENIYTSGSQIEVIFFFLQGRKGVLLAFSG